MTALATLTVLVVVGAAPAPAAPVPPTNGAGQVNDDGGRGGATDDGRDDDDDDGPGFLDRFHPVAFAPDLPPIVEDNLATFFFAGCLFPIGGNVWIPALLVGEPPPGYWTDAWVAFIVHVSTTLVVALALAAVTVVFQPLAAAYWPLVFLFAVVNAFYLMPVAAVNAYGRAVDRAEGRRRPSTKPRRAPSTGDDDPPAPAWMHEDPPPALEAAPPDEAPDEPKDAPPLDPAEGGQRF